MQRIKGSINIHCQGSQTSRHIDNQVWQGFTISIQEFCPGIWERKLCAKYVFFIHPLYCGKNSINLCYTSSMKFKTETHRRSHWHELVGLKPNHSYCWITCIIKASMMIIQRKKSDPLLMFFLTFSCRWSTTLVEKIWRLSRRYERNPNSNKTEIQWGTYHFLPKKKGVQLGHSWADHSGWVGGQPPPAWLS